MVAFTWSCSRFTVASFSATPSDSTTWATTIARRRAIDRVRREQSQRDRLDAVSREPVLASTDPADVVSVSLDSRRIGAALAHLPPDQRVVIQLAFLEGRTHEAIAAQLDLPLGTVKGRVRGGLKHLRGIIGDEQ